MTDWRDQRIAELEAAVAERDARIAQLEKALAAALARIDDLEARLNKNSNNSSTPPSANPPGAPKNKHKRNSGRKPGGQPGHPGSTRAVSVPDEVRDHFPPACHGCQNPLSDESRDFVAHQVTEIPPIHAVVIEHRLHRCHCTHCGRFTRASLPVGVPEGRFGPRLTGVVALLSGRFRLSRREVSVVLSQLFQVRLSVGAVQSLCEKASQAMAGVREEVIRQVLGQPVLHVDETGFPNRGRKNMLWIATNRQGTFFNLHRGRGHAGLDALIPDEGERVMVSDRLATYDRCESRQICHAHLLRDWTAILERKHPEAKRIGKWAEKETRRLLRYHRHWRQDDISRPLFRKRMTMLKARYAKLLDEAMECIDSKTSSLATQLNRRWECLWTFVDDEEVEPTNNPAERGIRPAVLWRKGSFGTQSEAGQRFVERSLTLAATAHQHGVNLLAFLETAIVAHLTQQAPPSLFDST